MDRGIADNGSLRSRYPADRSVIGQFRAAFRGVNGFSQIDPSTYGG
jgi:hypothetical protein